MAPSKALRLPRDPFSVIHATGPDPITDLAQYLAQCDGLIERWPRTDMQGNSQTIEVYADHTDWFNEVKRRCTKKQWTPDLLRVITADAPSALRLAAWIRKAQLGAKTLPQEWRAREYVRSLDAHYQQEQLVAPANTDFRVARCRVITISENLGTATWTTPAGKPRSQELAINDVPVAALKLEPTTGGAPIIVMAELPGGDAWRTQVFALKKAICGAKHLSSIYEDALARVEQLQRMVLRLRPAVAITPELIGGRQFQAAALHPDLAQQVMGGIISTQLAVEAAKHELLVTRQRSY